MPCCLPPPQPSRPRSMPSAPSPPTRRSSASGPRSANMPTDDAVMFIPQPVNAQDFLKDKQGPAAVAVDWWPAQSFVSLRRQHRGQHGPWVREWGKSVGYFTTVWQRQRRGQLAMGLRRRRRAARRARAERPATSRPLPGKLPDASDVAAAARRDGAGQDVKAAAAANRTTARSAGTGRSTPDGSRTLRRLAVERPALRAGHRPDRVAAQ